MKIESYQPPKSSFLSINKDLKLLIDKMLTNDRLCKLLYYTDKNPLEKKNLTQEEKLTLFGKQIRIVPKLYVDQPVLNYMIISFDNFLESSNPEFRDNIIEFDIICHFDQWQMRDFDLRPYRIAAEIDSMLDKKKLTGIGRLEFYGAKELLLTDEFGGLCLMFQTYHGEEDKKPMPNPEEQAKFEADFKEMTKNQKITQSLEYSNGLQASLNDRNRHSD